MSNFLVYFAILLLAVNILTVGTIPGAIIFNFGDSLNLILFGEDILGKVEGDNYWPISLDYGFIWPLSFPVLYFISTKLHTRETRFFLTEKSANVMFVLSELLFTQILAAYFRISYGG